MMNMNEHNDMETFNYQNVMTVANYLKIPATTNEGKSAKQQIKEMCVKKLCRVVGVTGKCNCGSVFFDFFSSIMGEALCKKLYLNEPIACDELRLVRYENVNLICEFESYLNSEDVDEAFLDGFFLADKYRHVMEKISHAY